MYNAQFPKISVIVPVYNIEEYVSKCIDSILQQTYENIEIICVDDGSTDKSGQIIDSYAIDNEKIHVIHKTNGGLVSARKAGAAATNGDFVLNIDGDDWIEPNYVENFAKNISEKVDVIWSVAYYKEYTKHKAIREFVNAESLPRVQQNYMKDLVCGKYGYQSTITFSLGLVCIRRNLYVEIQQSIDDKISMLEDKALIVRLLGVTGNILFIHNLGYHYIQRNNSIVHMYNEKSIEQIDVMMDDTINFLQRLLRKNELLEANIITSGLKAKVLKDFAGLQDKTLSYLYPFKNVKKNSKVVVYGTGTAGCQIANYLRSSREYELVAWVDSNTYGQIIDDYKILSPRSIADKVYDYVIIATILEDFAREMRRELMTLGVTDDKIEWIDKMESAD